MTYDPALGRFTYSVSDEGLLTSAEAEGSPYSAIADADGNITNAEFTPTLKDGRVLIILTGRGAAPGDESQIMRLQSTGDAACAPHGHRVRRCRETISPVRVELRRRDRCTRRDAAGDEDLRIVTAWNAGSERPGNLPALVGAILPRLRQLPPPAELAAVHTSVCSALDAVAKAAAAPAGSDSAGRVSGGDLTRATARLREAVKEFAPGRHS